MRSVLKCYYCHSQKHKPILQLGLYNLFKCQNCVITYLYPRVHIKIKEENDKKYNSKEDEKSYLGIYDQMYKRAKRYIKQINKYKKSGKYLDIGCSYGVYLKVAKEVGFDTYGVEIAPNAAIIARKRFKLNVFTGTLEHARYKNNTFDVVTLYDVLEHIPNIKQFLKEINRVLKPGGLLVIQCPNIESYAFKVLQKDWNWLLAPYHLWHFSKTSINKVLGNYNFSIVKYSTWDSPYDFASNWVSKIGLTKANASFPRKFIRKTVYLFLYGSIGVGSLIWSRYNRGGSQIVYATKNKR